MLCLILLAFLIPQINAKCPNDSVEWHSKCYFFMPNAVGFPVAEVNCQNLGGNLASVHDGFTNALLTDKANENFSGAENFWIGLSNVVDQGNLTWIDGSIVDFVDWEKSQPANITESRCTAAKLINGLWLVESCWHQKPYICAVEMSSVTTETTSMKTTTKHSTIRSTTSRYSTTPSGPCSGNLTYYAATNSCYGLFFTKPIDTQVWMDGERYCQRLGGHLASVHNSDDIKFIMSFNYEALGIFFPWIGLSSNDQGETWYWSDGTPADYLPWYENSPRPGDGCAFVRYNAIVSISCYEFASTLCEIPL